MVATAVKFTPPQTFEDALREIRSFWRGDLPFGPGDPAELERLEASFRRRFPIPLRRYISELAPTRAHATLEQVGNPVDLWPTSDLTTEPLGYRVDTRGNKLSDWSPDWLLFADVGADPIIVDLTQATDATCPVLEAMHGAGEWDFYPVADSIPQYLLLSAATAHALTLAPEPIIDEPGKFDLARPDADWLFPRMRGWAGAYYEDWLGVFTNR